MATFNPSDLQLASRVVSTMKQGALEGFIADADLATSKAAIITAIRTRTGVGAGLTPKVRQDQIPRVIGLIDAVDKGYGLIGSTVFTGGSLAAVYAAVPGTWSAGGDRVTI